MLVAVYSNIEELPVCQAMSVNVSQADSSIQGVTLTSVGYLIEPAGNIFTSKTLNDFYRITIFCSC